MCRYSDEPADSRFKMVEEVMITICSADPSDTVHNDVARIFAYNYKYSVHSLTHRIRCH